MSDVDAVVIGSGPNGSAAAIAIAQTGRKVMLFEAAGTTGAATDALVHLNYGADVQCR